MRDSWRDPDPYAGFREDAHNISDDFARALNRFAAEVARDVMGDREGTIYVSYSPTRRVTDEDSSARSSSYTTPKKRRVIASKLASIWSIISAKLKPKRKK